MKAPSCMRQMLSDWFIQPSAYRVYVYIFGTSFISQPIIVLQAKRKLASLRKEKQVSFAYGGAKYDVPVWICLAFLFQYELGQCLKSLPHDSTHEQKNRGGYGGTKRIYGWWNSSANPFNTAETVWKTFLSNLHTHEATGSSPVVSTKTTKSELVPNRGWVRICLLFGRYHLTQKVIPPRDDLLRSDIENVWKPE